MDQLRFNICLKNKCCYDLRDKQNRNLKLHNSHNQEATVQMIMRGWGGIVFFLTVFVNNLKVYDEVIISVLKMGRWGKIS